MKVRAQLAIFSIIILLAIGSITGCDDEAAVRADEADLVADGTDTADDSYMPDGEDAGLETSEVIDGDPGDSAEGDQGDSVEAETADADGESADTDEPTDAADISREFEFPASGDPYVVRVSEPSLKKSREPS